jgi:hypothetical protein
MTDNNPDTQTDPEVRFKELQSAADVMFETTQQHRYLLERQRESAAQHRACAFEQRAKATELRAKTRAIQSKYGYDIV